MEEQWRDIIWYEWKYQVSNIGRIKSLYSMWRRSIKQNREKILKNWYIKWKKWYLKTALTKDWKTIHFQIHRLVAQVFLSNIENKPQVNHIDWNPENNNIWNLEWCTASENAIHSHRVLWNKSSMFWKYWILHHRSKKIWQYDLQWELIKNWNSMNEIQRELWFNTWWIQQVCTWKIKKYKNFIWWYINS